jgi:hypothetical protein
MDCPFDEAIAKLNHLSAVRDKVLIRAELLPADLALVGLYNELREAAFQAMELCHLHAQSAAFPLARTVFEATQQIIVLATEDDYVGVGTRAWLYYLRKERRVVYFARGDQAAQDWFQQAVSEIRLIWAAYNSDAEKILRDEDARLDVFQKNRGGADNFMGRNIGKIVEERYPKLAVAPGRSAAELSRLNSGIYTALSRESHAHLRVAAAALRVAPDGTVSIVPQKVDETSKNKLVLGCVSSSLAEASAGLSYLIDGRQRRRSAELERAAARLIEKPLAPGFKPDLGLHLMRGGGTSSSTFHFSNVPVQKVGILSNGTVSWSSNITLGEQETFIATFDVPQLLVPELQRALGVESSALAPGSQVKKHRLTQPRAVRLDCTLGEIRNSSGDAFVPLSVTRIVIQEIGHPEAVTSDAF